MGRHRAARSSTWAYLFWGGPPPKKKMVSLEQPPKKVITLGSNTWVLGATSMVLLCKLEPVCQNPLGVS